MKKTFSAINFFEEKKCHLCKKGYRAILKLASFVIFPKDKQVWLSLCIVLPSRSAPCPPSHDCYMPSAPSSAVLKVSEADSRTSDDEGEEDVDQGRQQTRNKAFIDFQSSF